MRVQWFHGSFVLVFVFNSLFQGISMKMINDEISVVFSYPNEKRSIPLTNEQKTTGSITVSENQKQWVQIWVFVAMVITMAHVTLHVLTTCTLIAKPLEHVCAVTRLKISHALSSLMAYQPLLNIVIKLDQCGWTAIDLDQAWRTKLDQVNNLSTLVHALCAIIDHAWRINPAIASLRAPSAI